MLISGNGSNLQALIEHNNHYGDLLLVISNNPDAYGVQRARKASIDCQIIDNKNYTNREQFDRQIANCLQDYRIDLVLLAGFMRILTPGFIQQFKGKILNVHPSLLPKYQGLSTHQKVLEAADRYHGASVHFVTDQLDSGPIVLQDRFKVAADATAASLQEQVHQIEHRIYPLVMQWYCQDRLLMDEERVLLDGKPLPVGGLQYPLYQDKVPTNSTLNRKQLVAERGGNLVKTPRQVPTH